MPTWTSEALKKFGRRRKSTPKITDIQGPTDFRHVLHIDEKMLENIHPRVRHNRSHSEVPAIAHSSTMPKDFPYKLNKGTAGSASGLDAIVPHITENQLRDSARFYSRSRPALPTQWTTSPSTIVNDGYFLPGPKDSPNSSAYGTMTGTFSSNGSKTFVNQTYVDSMMRERYRERSQERQLVGILKTAPSNSGIFNKADGTDKSFPKRLRQTPQNSPKPIPRRQQSVEPSPPERPTRLGFSQPSTPITYPSPTLDLTARSTISISINDERSIAKQIEKLYEERAASPVTTLEDDIIITRL